MTKRLMLKTLARIYDPLGIISPMIVEGKHLYRQAVDEKKGWDKPVSERLKKKWNKWVRNLTTVKVPRSIAPYFEDIIQVSLHHFMDASDKAVSAQTVVVVAQPSGVTQGSLTSKSRITNRGLTIPRQELVGCQMGANLALNTRKALKNLPIIHNVCWTDSTIALCWVRNPFKNWKTVVVNRTKKISEITQELNLEWRYVPTALSHSYFGSKGAQYDHLEKENWWAGPPWIQDTEQWPKIEVNLEENVESIQGELKRGDQLLYCAEDNADLKEMHSLLERKTFKGTWRILGWCLRFISNCKTKGSKDKRKWGLLTTEEIENADKKLIRKFQQGINLESKEAQELGLTMCDDKVIRSFGRLPDHQPIFIPKQSLYAVRIGEEVHRQVGHKGVNTMMAKIRKRFWIPTLRTILKKIKGRCESCKVMAAKPFPVPTAGQLPQSRVTADYPFGVIGIHHYKELGD